MSIKAAAVKPAPYDNPSDWRRARKVLAQSFYKELKGSGLSARQIIELSNELLTLVSADFETGEHRPV